MCLAIRETPAELDPKGVSWLMVPVHGRSSDGDAISHVGCGRECEGRGSKVRSDCTGGRDEVLLWDRSVSCDGRASALDGETDPPCQTTPTSGRLTRGRQEPGS
ncbi:MAG: hypothetical protein A07HR60_02513 [uncultured archaeon A07HR60]|nr:MAG: hypothetical protein A07HR60_02513 [uncultured archaeon A07HR60]